MAVTAGGDDPRPTLRHRLEYAGLCLALAVARRISVERLAAAGASVMRLVGPRLRQHRRALRNLAVAYPERTPAEIDGMARAMWANMGRTFAETLVLDRLAGDPDRFVFDERPLWEARTREAGTLVACTLHLGNWELIAQPLVDFGRQPVGVYKPLDNPLIDAWLVRSRAGIYRGGLLGKGDRDDEAGTGQRTARQLIDKARSNGTICFVVDHFDRRGEPIPFMGRSARFSTAPAAIARHVGARVWLGRCKRIGASSRFHVEVREVAVPRTADRKADAVALTAAMFAVLDDWVRDAPEQWMWWNTRWVDPVERAALGSDAAT